MRDRGCHHMHARHPVHPRLVRRAPAGEGPGHDSRRESGGGQGLGRDFRGRGGPGGPREPGEEGGSSLHPNAASLICTPMTATRRFVAAAMLIGLPALTGYVWLCLRFFNGSFIPSKIGLATHRVTDYLPTLSFASIAFYAFWLLLQAALYVVLPGRAVVGSVLSD